MKPRKPRTNKPHNDGFPKTVKCDAYRCGVCRSMNNLRPCQTCRARGTATVENFLAAVGVKG